ncbi:MAG: copper resistance protein CopC [Thiobacillus sp.]|nr:copper resistance CopC family protein [Thiobacillus sp.]QLQ02103.1 MAG: copper resistance protein CopC [Thiobacillus sp.]
MGSADCKICLTVRLDLIVATLFEAQLGRIMTTERIAVHLQNVANVVFFIGTLYFAMTSIAMAHSGLEHAEPAVESLLKRAPSEIKLFFSEKIEGAYSSVRVLNGSGQRVDNKDNHVDRTNPILIRASLRPLKRESIQ